jgi:hypothetical protein
MKTRFSILFALGLLVLGITPAGAQEADGQISGRVVDTDGRSLASHRVELRRPASAGPGRLVTVTDDLGQFFYRGLDPGRYEVELREQDRVVATSGPIDLAAGAMSVSDIAMTAPALRSREHRGVLFWTAVGAGVGVGTGLVYMATNPDCRYKESLCPLAPMMLGATGAAFGFLIGLGR